VDRRQESADDRGGVGMGINGFSRVLWHPLETKKMLLTVGNGNMSQRDENRNSIFTMTFPFPSFYFQVFLYVWFADGNGNKLVRRMGIEAKSSYENGWKRES